MLRCTQPDCENDAVRVLVNSAGYLHLECAEHVNARSTSATGRLVRLDEGAMSVVRRSGFHPFPGSETIEIGVELALTLYIMGT